MPDFKKESPALSIAAALIQRDGKYLIGQRPEHKPQGGYWEFAGGKLKPGETQRQALVRECREELDVLVQPAKLVLTTEYQYPDRRVTLYFWDTVLVKGTPRCPGPPKAGMGWRRKNWSNTPSVRRMRKS